MAKKILVAEDSVTMQRVIQMTFEAEDVTVTAVATVEDALARAREMRPDIVIADLSMAGKNGYDACLELKRAQPVPVLLLHGLTSPIDRDRARQVGADGELAKPFETQALIDRVQELLVKPAPAGDVHLEVKPLSSPIESQDIVIDAAQFAPKAAAAPAAKPPATTAPAAPKLAAPTPGLAAPRPPATPKPPMAPAAQRVTTREVVSPPQAAPKPAPPAAKAPAPAAPKPAPKPAAARPPVPAAPRPPVPTAPRQPVPTAPRPAPMTAKAPVAPARVVPVPMPPADEPAQPDLDVEITIEAEPPPPAAREALPSFSSPVALPKPPPGMSLPPPPPGMALPGARLAPQPVGTVPEVAPLVVPPPPAVAPAPPPAVAPPAVAPAPPPAVSTPAVAAKGPLDALAGIDPAVIEAIAALTREVVEQVVWEVVPDLAETIIKEELERLIAARGK